MKRATILVYFVLLTFNCVLGQEKATYSSLINEAWNLYESEEYLKSAQKYSEAFVVGNGGTIDDNYNAACSWALADRPDSSFVHLFLIVDKGNYTDIEHLLKDSDLYSLHEDSRWDDLLTIIRSNREDFDEQIILILDTIYQTDQGYRLQVDEIAQEYGNESEEYYDFVKKIRESDSINLLKVRKILDEHGWLGPDIIGNQGSITLFLVIQHSPPEILAKYLPMMRDAVAKRNAHAIHLALMEDRNAMYQGEKQIYGSQIGQDPETGEYYVLPLIDPDKVDQRRAEVGLGPIQDYVSNWGMNWDVEEYKKKLPLYEAMQDEW